MLFQPATKIRIRLELERPTQSELHDASSFGFAQRFLRRRKHSESWRRRSNRRKTKLALQERIDRAHAESRRTGEALSVGDVIDLPAESNTLTAICSELKGLVQAAIESDIARQPQRVAISTFSGHGIAIAQISSERIGE